MPINQQGLTMQQQQIRTQQQQQPMNSTQYPMHQISQTGRLVIKLLSPFFFVVEIVLECH